MPPDRRQIILIILSLTILAGLTSFFTWQALMRKPADPWATLPQGTEAVVRINATSFFGKPATANNELLSRLGSLPWAGPSIRNLMDLDSLYRLSPERFNGMNQNELLLVLAATRNGWASFLMADASGVFGRRQWLDALALLGKVQPGSSPEKYSFSAKTDPPAQLEFRNGLLIISYGVPQAQQSATEFTSPPPAIREALRHAGSKVIASLLISNGLLHNLLLMSDSLPYPPPWKGSEEGWTVLDINVKSRDIYLSGYALNGQYPLPEAFLAAGQDQSPLPNLIPPEATQWSRMGNIEAGFVFSTTDSLGTIPSGSLRLFQIHLGAHHDPVYVIQAADSSLSHLLQNDNPGLTARLASPELSSWLQKLSAGHQDTTAFWLLGYEQAWVAGRDQTQLRKLIADLRSNRTIEGSPWFEQLQEKLPDEASLWGRKSIAQSGSREKKSLPLSLAWAVQPGNHPLISLVISSESPGNGREESRPILTAGTITHRPFAIWDPAKKRYDILVFDNTHTATLFTPDGEVLWDYPLDGVPLGDIQLLDPRRNGQWLILFNTASRIYLLDRKGYDVEGFPLDLSPLATNPVAAIDYEGRKDYRIFVATADGYIRNLDIRGKEISSWTRPRMESPVHLPLQHLVMHDRDYLVIASEDGQVLMTDRKGAERVSVKRAFENSTQTPFFLQRIEGENRLITTDRQGKVQAILRNGKVFSSHLETFSDRHKFCYAPFSTDRASDYIFLDENRLVVYSRSGKKITEWIVPGKPTGGPEVLQLGPARYLAVADSSAANIYLFREGLDQPVHQMMGRFIPLNIDLDQDLRPELLTADLQRVLMQPLQR